MARTGCSDDDQPRAGPGLTRPLVVAVHGAVVNAASWLPLQRQLHEEIEFVAVDLPGHGTRRDTPFSISSALDVIDAALPRTAVQRPVVLIGDSLGGYLALLTAARVGWRVHAVVAAGASYDLRGLAGVLVQLTDLPSQLMTLCLGEKNASAFFSMAMNFVADRATVEAIVARGIRIASRGESIEALRHINIIAAIQACKGRVYMVNGSLDFPMVRNTRSFAGYAAQGYAVVIPGAFHGCSVSRPTEFADVVRTAIAAAQVDIARNL